MANKKLEEKLFDILDWIPMYGAERLFKRLEKMPYKLKKSPKNKLYIFSNGIFNAGPIVYGLYHLINYLVKIR